jgi:hypothetical protein
MQGRFQNPLGFQNSFESGIIAKKEGEWKTV